LTCPYGYTTIIQDEELFCAGAKCTAADTSTCCKPAALCETMRCSDEKVHKKSPLEVMPPYYCSGDPCVLADEPRCCEPRASCTLAPCPKYMVPKSQGGLCAAAICNPQDTNQCCTTRVDCTTFQCPPDAANRGELAYCAGDLPESCDEDTCCFGGQDSTTPHMVQHVIVSSAHKKKTTPAPEKILQDEVKFSFKVVPMNATVLSSDGELRVRLVSVLRRLLASEAGIGVGFEDVNVSFSEGLWVNITVIAPGAAQSAMVAKHLDEIHLKEVERSITHIEGIDKATEGGAEALAAGAIRITDVKEPHVVHPDTFHWQKAKVSSSAPSPDVVVSSPAAASSAAAPAPASAPAPDPSPAGSGSPGGGHSAASRRLPCASAVAGLPVLLLAASVNVL